MGDPLIHRILRNLLPVLLVGGWIVGCVETTLLPPGHAELRTALGENGNASMTSRDGRIEMVSLRDAGVRDISPLAGLPLRSLDLTGVPVTDLAPLRGMPLEALYLRDTRIADLSPLAGMRLKRLAARNTRVSDIDVLADMPLVELDLSGTPVEKIEAVGTMPLASLDLRDTRVTDLSPLTDSRLRRLIFTPSRIESGLDAIREMKSLEVLDVRSRAEKPFTPAEFWRRFDAGEFGK